METRSIAEGMTVRAVDGRRLGKVKACEDGWFMVHAGLLFSKDHFIRYDQVAEVREGDVFLKVKELERAAVGEEGPDAPITGIEAPRAPVAPSGASIGVGGTLGAAGLGTSGGPAGAAMSAGVEAIAHARGRDELRRPRPASEDERTATLGGGGPDPDR